MNWTSKITRYILIIWLIIVANQMEAQMDQRRLEFFEPSDSLFNKSRFTTAAISAGAIYTGFSIALYNTWYSQFPQSGFHLFNDLGEWENMDKMGHVYTAYFQGVLVYKGTRWIGMKERERIIWGITLGSLFQTTIEVMDGFSEQWGFSIPDFAANTLGIGAFALQQVHWGEQRIMLKVSNSLPTYDDVSITSNDGKTTTTLNGRTDEIFGTSLPERFLKDYNGQTIWMSANIRSFFKEKQNIPQWLNVAVGYGAQNMYGGYGNNFSIDGVNYNLNISLPRYRQYFLSLDLDLTRIQTKSPFLKTLFSVLNIFKIPAPGLEYNSLGELKWHWILF